MPSGRRLYLVKDLKIGDIVFGSYLGTKIPVKIAKVFTDAIGGIMISVVEIESMFTIGLIRFWGFNDSNTMVRDCLLSERNGIKLLWVNEDDIDKQLKIGHYV